MAVAVPVVIVVVHKLVWFYRKLPVSVAEDFEVRICKNDHHSDENVVVENMEIFVK